MHRLAELVLRYKEYVAALLLTVVSLLMINASSNSRLRSFRTISVGIVAGVQSVFDWIPNPYALQSENHALRQLSKDLSLQSMQLRELAVKAEKYREMLGFRETSPMKLVTAEVIGKTTIQLRNTATLNVGEKNGVKEGMPVITERGLVGQVIGVNDHYSVVQLLMNRDTRVAARTLGARNNGLIVWDGGSQLILRDMPTSQKQKKGDTVVTSNYSSIFPENIIIGTIAEIEEEPGTLYYRIRVDPAVNFGTLEEAFVVLHSPDDERLELERRLLQNPQSEEGGQGQAR